MRYVKTHSVVVKKPPKKHLWPKLVLLLIIIVIVASLAQYGYAHWSNISSRNRNNTSKSNTTSISKTGSSNSGSTSSAQPNNCASNSLPQLILVSVSQRHLWACNGSTQVFDSPVVTGIQYLPADLTPVGTYHIYGKETNQHLTGCDSTGCWNDFVNYWMPFLDNQYGQYGFHDATWRSNNAFGNISPNSPSASHGCVECPLATAKWLYNWAQVGTTVTIET